MFSLLSVVSRNDSFEVPPRACVGLFPAVFDIDHAAANTIYLPDGAVSILVVVGDSDSLSNPEMITAIITEVVGCLVLRAVLLLSFRTNARQDAPFPSVGCT